jgi:hypothetical protein
MLFQKFIYTRRKKILLRIFSKIYQQFCTDIYSVQNYFFKVINIVNNLYVNKYKTHSYIYNSLLIIL